MVESAAPLRSSDSNLTRRDRWNQKTGFTFRGAARGPYKKKAPWVPVIPPDDLLRIKAAAEKRLRKQAKRELAASSSRQGSGCGTSESVTLAGSLAACGALQC